MSWRFSRRINFGPLRITFSKSGIGWSLGGKGYRTGVDSKGRKYNNVSIPGTGVSKRTYENTPSANSSNKKFHWGIIIIIFVVISFVRNFMK